MADVEIMEFSDEELEDLATAVHFFREMSEEDRSLMSTHDRKRYAKLAEKLSAYIPGAFNA